ncbi:MAG: response regulator [Planctomycetes bacterium]|nr:response regulator [Planctomycetota bacterium]
MTPNPISILMIDDQPIMAAAIRRLLAPATDMIVHYCQDSSKGEAEAETRNPSLVIVDFVMPVVSGLEVVRRLRENPKTATVPIIMMSSIDDPQTKAEAFNTGADDYVIKLPDPVELMARIRALLRRAKWHS